MDTDSFIIEITDEKFDEIMFENKELFDLVIIIKYQEK